MKEKSKEKDNIKKDNKSRKVEETPKHYKDGEFKKVEKKEVKENKLNKVILTILLILVILVIAIGIIYGGRIINKAKLDKELENLVSKDVSVEEIENTETITSGDFATVEETVKQYFKEYTDLKNQFTEKMNDEKIQTILIPENYNNDGPEFEDSINYINKTKEEFNQIADSLMVLLSKENIESRIENEDISDYYKELYKGYFIEDNELSSTFQESHQDIVDSKTLMNNLYNNQIKILNFLKENKAHWEVLDGKLAFDNEELTNTYNDMKNNLFIEQE